MGCKTHVLHPPITNNHASIYTNQSKLTYIQTLLLKIVFLLKAPKQMNLEREKDPI